MAFLSVTGSLNRIVFSFFILTALCLCTAAVFAQLPAEKVRITVLDTANAAVSGASVRVTSAGGKSYDAVTGADGVAVIDGVKPGTFRVLVEAQGFPKVIRDAVLKEGNGPGSIDIVLTPGPIREDVNVTAARTQVTSMETAEPVSVIGREEIDRKAVNSIGDIFRTLPGASTATEGPFSVRPRIRGLDSNRVLILVDGERLNNSRTSTGQSGIETGLVDTSQIESVEVVRGGGSVLYGTDALAGTINIITRDTPPKRDGGIRFGSTLDTFYTSNESGRRGSLAINGSGKFFAFRASQSLERFDNYFTGKSDGQVPADLLDIGGITADGEVLNSQSHGGNTQAVGRFFINDTSTLRFNFDRRRAANIGSPTLVGVFNGFFPFSNRDKFSGRYDAVNLSDQLQRLSISSFYQKQDRDFTNILTVDPVPPFFPGLYQFSQTVTNTNTAGFDVQTDWNLGTRNRLVAGVSFFRDGNTDQRLIITASTPASGDRNTRNSRSVPDASLSNIAIFGQNEYRVTSRLKLIGGIRYDRFTTKADPTPEFTLDPRFTASQIEDLGLAGLTDGLNVTNTAITGDIGAVYKLTDNVSSSARIGHSFRTPNIFERFFTDFGSVDGFVVGNPRLVPESGINFDTSVKFQTSHIKGDVTYFNNYYENFLATPEARDRNGDPIFIDRAPRAPIPVYQTQNVRKARIQGFEAELEVPFKISLGYLTPYGNFSYLRGDNLSEDVPLDSISPFRTNIGFRWQNFLRNYYTDYNARIIGRQDRLSPTFLLPVNQGGNGGPEAGFVTHNISGGYYFRRERFDLSINLGVSNIFNRAFSEQFVYAPARGRSFTIGTTWEIK